MLPRAENDVLLMTVTDALDLADEGDAPGGCEGLRRWTATPSSTGSAGHSPPAWNTESRPMSAQPPRDDEKARDATSARHRWAGRLLVLALGGATLAWAVSRRMRRGWLAHRRGEGPAAAQEQEPRPGDILLFHHVARFRDVLIVWVTRSPFYHAALYADAGHVVEARPRGVGRNSLRGRERNFVVIPAPEGQGEAALAWANTQLGAPFDRWDLWVIFLEHLFTHWHINYNPHGKYTCAELVATAYQHAGVRLVPEKELDEIAPADLARLLPPARCQTPPPSPG
jgi:hypothetical protein